MPQKYCRKSEPPEQGARALQTTDRQTTVGRAIAYSERERELTFANDSFGQMDQKESTVQRPIKEEEMKPGALDASVTTRRE